MGDVRTRDEGGVYKERRGRSQIARATKRFSCFARVSTRRPPPPQPIGQRRLSVGETPRAEESGTRGSPPNGMTRTSPKPSLALLVRLLDHLSRQTRSATWISILLQVSHPSKDRSRDPPCHPVDPSKVRPLELVISTHSKSSIA